jgi:predicted regulator of Ras-like GTPase activity (Roadblock/LC7/MglB family)
MIATAMSSLSQVVQGLARREGVQAALLLSGDGLAIAHHARERFEPEAVAALAATLARFAGQLGDGARQGPLHTAVLEYAEGLLILARIGTGDWLAIVAAADADVGTLLFDLRQHRTALAALL